MYLLDTNILSELVRREPNAIVAARFEAAPAHELCTSAVCIEEVAFGARIAPAGNRVWERFEEDVLPRLTVVDFDLTAALAGGRLRGEQHEQGTLFGYADALIAATAIVYEVILVTRNTRHFARVHGLKLENWFEPPPSAQG